jgi:branched-chain amino acid transport system ATP-binding protein
MSAILEVANATRPILEVANATVRFGGVTAVDDVSFSVEAGEFLGLIGPNGAGKTTLLRVVTGVVRPQAGRVAIAGQDATGLTTAARVRLGLGLSHQIVRPFRSMTVVENVMVAAGFERMANPLTALFARDREREKARALELLNLVGIADAAEARPATLPLGMLKRLEVARALALDPKVLLLDEPLAGLNHLEAGRLADTVAELNAEGMTIVLIEHNLSEVIRVTSRLVVIDNGRKIAEGAPRRVMDDPAVRAAYLGQEADGAAA